MDWEMCDARFRPPFRLDARVGMVTLSRGLITLRMVFRAPCELHSFRQRPFLL